MLGFVTHDAEMPEKRTANTRKADFDEIYRQYAADKAAEQANRCSQCGVPFCQVHCPLQNNIPDWLKLTAEGRLEDAYALSASTNSFPEICGRICPQDRLCEGNCVIEQSGHGAITIGAIEKYITDTAWERGWVQAQKPRHERPEHIGIIGSGPAGLAAAERLRQQGFQVTIYDRHDRMGGLLIYGIPGFKLEKHLVTRRIDWLKDMGVEFRAGVAVGQDISFDQLRQQHDAVIIATGVYQPRQLEIPGMALAGIVPALEYLIASNRAGLGDYATPPAPMNAAGKNVVVIGGGDTAMDCVRTAIRQGAQKVTCLYRRDRANMPGSRREVHHAEEEGVVFRWLAAPIAMTGTDHVTSIEIQQLRLGMPDGTGRRQPEAIQGATEQIATDMVITALGFEPEHLPSLFDCPGLGIQENGTIKVDRAGMTNMPGVFAAGDIVRGASLVVWGIKDGRDVADSIGRYLAQSDAHLVAAQ